MDPRTTALRDPAGLARGHSLASAGIGGVGVDARAIHGDGPQAIEAAAGREPSILASGPDCAGEVVPHDAVEQRERAAVGGVVDPAAAGGAAGTTGALRVCVRMVVDDDDLAQGQARVGIEHAAASDADG